MRYKVDIKDFCALVSEGQLETEQIYLCHEGHLFEKPGYKQVKQINGFEKEIAVCPICGCGKSFYSEFQVKQIKGSS
ncbi:hypothetical protein [Bacillus haynesii]|uniref:hypothetical protein n=1 Tax=Bacillus haynesii TaxID=1925021 RepID=UPI0022823009|nr:hypothetical protein [Bacillus haynesii]MCY9156345.1 hypothetical protein [Bacillus haynesii]MCY9452163.1 hypothetical protein [Bacillus haynesii]MEC0685947.1 hypothetical protein [Bacillus haynesii]